MPELPEVETLRIQFAQLLPGLAIKNVQVFNQKSFVGEKKYVIGKKVIGVRRFAKILVVDLFNGLSLAIHLKMSGQLIYYPTLQLRYPSRHSKVVNNLPNKHTRVVITFTNGDRLFFNDQRLFGWLRILRNKPINQLSNKPINQKNAKLKIPYLKDVIKKLGPEPLRDLTLEKLKKILKSTRKPVKIVLMDQEKIGGVGNIYANDALFLAGIRPETSANRLLNAQVDVLYHKLLKVLKEGIKWRGASQNNFRDAYGQRGEKQEHFYVYDRAGDACINKCGGIIKRITLGGRGSFYCPNCQKN